MRVVLLPKLLLCEALEQTANLTNIVEKSCGLGQKKSRDNMKETVDNYKLVRILLWLFGVI
jgi:hypothetical protein